MTPPQKMTKSHYHGGYDKQATYNISEKLRPANQAKHLKMERTKNFIVSILIMLVRCCSVFHTGNRQLKIEWEEFLKNILD